MAAVEARRGKRFFLGLAAALVAAAALGIGYSQGALFLERLYQLPVVGKLLPKEPLREEQVDPYKAELEAIEKSKLELAAMESELGARESQLKAREAALLQKEAQVEALKKELEAEKSELQARNVQLKQLASMFAQMRAQQAALIMKQLDDQTVINIISRLDDRTAAGILAAMEPARAARLTLELISKGSTDEVASSRR